MTIQPIKGFPLSDDYAATRVPNAVLGRVLANIDDADVIKLVLRAVWLLERQRGFPRYIAVEDLQRDRVVSNVFASPAALERALETVIEHGVLAKVGINGSPCLMLNTESAQRATMDSPVSLPVAESTNDADGWDSPAAASMPADAFRTYEENIGLLSPMIRESILAALEDFTDDDITRAIRIAVENESRSWSFVAGVLRRWSREGIPDERTDGTTGGADDRRVPEAELRKYLDEQRKRSRARSA